MILTINTEDSRDLRALQLAATADTWKPITGQGVRGEAFSVPSSDGRHFYVTTAETCTCADAARGNVCKHRRACAYYLALSEAVAPKPTPVAAQPAPSYRLEGEALWARFKGD
jgi:hypothetical protein